MANITLNVEGDLNIFVSGEDGQPESLYLDSDNGTVKIEMTATDEEDSSEGDEMVLYFLPGEELACMSLFHALQLMLDNDGVDSLERLPACGLFAAFNSDDVITDDEGNTFLAGPIMVFKVSEEADVLSLTDEEIDFAKELLEDGTVRLPFGKIHFFAYRL